MSSEVCPFCGKTYKRLKSHLPHCKAAASAKTPPTKHDASVNQTTSTSQMSVAPITPKAKVGKSTQALSVGASPQSKKSKKVSVISSPPVTPLERENTSSSVQSLSPSSASLPLSTKKKKQKLSEQIKTDTMSSSTTTSLISTQSQSPPLSPINSKPKKKSLRDSIEAAKSKQVSQGSPEDLPSDSTPFVADPLSSRTTEQIETKTNPYKDLVKDNAHPAFLSTDTKPKGGSKMKASKAKKAAQSLPTTKDTSSFLDSIGNQSSARPHAGDNFLVDNEGGSEVLSVNKMFLKSGSGHKARITLQDVKATLGRANTTRRSSRPSILNQIQTTDDLSSKIRPGAASLSPVLLPTGHQKDVDSCLVTNKTTSQHAELQSSERKSSKTKQASLIPVRHDGSPQPELTRPATPLLSSQVSQVKSPPQAVSVSEGLKVSHQVTGLPTVSPSLTQFSPSPHLFPFTTQTLPARVETMRAGDGLMMEKSQLEVGKQNTADNGTKGGLTQRSLGQVRLRELPQWLACKTPSHPRDVVNMVQRGWQWYYRRYINVKKGGIGGVGMLLAGYCVLSYIWSYPHIKRDRWRKHH